MAVTQLYFQNTRAQRSVDGSASFSRLVKKLGMALDHPVSCGRMLAGKTVNPAPLISPGPTVSSPAIPMSPLTLENDTVAEVSSQARDGLLVRAVELDRVMHDLGVQPTGNHGYLMNLRLRVSKAVGPAALPGLNQLEASFLVPIYVDPATHVVQGCRDP